MRIFGLALAAAILSTTPAMAAESAADFQLFSLGNLTLQGQNISNRVAAGGNATFYGSSISGASADFAASLVVGGNLTYHNGGSIAGQALVGGNSSAPGYLPVLANQALPIDFAAEAIRLKDLSAELAGRTSNGSAELKWGGLHLAGSDAGLNVFTVTTDMLAQASWFNASIAPGSQVLINVVGGSANLKGGLNFYEAPNILWNFSQASSITAGGLSLSGTVLAPHASFQGNSGTIAGDLIVGNFNGAMSFAGSGYGGSLIRPTFRAPIDDLRNTAVPEPGVWALMILGFGLAGAMLRRRRGALDLAA